MAAHRYWRIRALTVPGPFFEPAELQLFAGNTRVDGPATMTSSIAPDGGTLADLKDANMATRAYWAQATAQDAGFWIAWDFGTATEVDGLKQAGYDTATRYMSAFTVQWSDNGTSWTDQTTFTGLGYPGNGMLSVAYSWAPPGAGGATYRYWRIYVTEVDGSTGFASFGEVEFFGAVGGPDLTDGRGGFVSQSGDGSVGTAASAIDNSIGTEAGSAFPLPYWWQMEFGAPTYIDYITIRAQRIVPNRSPKSFIVQGSNDALSWTDVTAFGPSTGWVEYEQRIFILDVPSFEVSGIVTNDSGAPAARTVRVYRRDTGALLGETTSNGTTGAYSFTSVYSGEVQVVCLDDSAGSVYNDLILRATPT